VGMTLIVRSMIVRMRRAIRVCVQVRFN